MLCAGLRLAWLPTSYFFWVCPGAARGTMLSSAAEKVELKPNKINRQKCHRVVGEAHN